MPEGLDIPVDLVYGTVSSKLNNTTFLVANKNYYKTQKSQSIWRPDKKKTAIEFETETETSTLEIQPLSQ